MFFGEKKMFIKTKYDLYGLHFQIKIGKYNFKFKFNKDYDLATTLGIRNNLPDGTRIIHIDYDNHLIEHLTPELKHLQKKYKLSEFYLFKSSQKKHGFHAICLDKLNYEEWIRLIGETSCDDYYKYMPITNDFHSWVLRVLSKGKSKVPVLIKVLRSSYQKRKKSYAHHLFLKNHYNIKVKKPQNMDKNIKLYSVYYGTLNYLKRKKYKKRKR